VTLARLITFVSATLCASAVYGNDLADAEWRVEFDWSTHVELGPDCSTRGHPDCFGDNWPTTWRKDGSTLSAWGDGAGPDIEKPVSLGFARLTIDGADFQLSPSYRGFTGDRVAYNSNCGGQIDRGGKLCGKTYALLDVDGTIWTFISPGSSATNYSLARLYRSDDDAHSFTPVRDRSKRRPYIEFRAADGLTLPAFMQAGPGYADAESHDGYVYVYTIRPFEQRRLAVQRPPGGGIIDLARVPTADIDDLSRYEWFSGSADRPAWSGNHTHRTPVFRDPAGVGWTVSVAWVARLERYVLATEHTRSFEGRLGLYSAKTPWGPWKQLARYADWPCETGAPDGVAQNAFYWNFPTALLESDSPDFWMVFTGVGADDSFNAVRGRFVQRSATGNNRRPDCG